MKSPPVPDPYVDEHKAEPSKLTIKQAKFIDAYLETGKGAEAARQAGYSANTARQMANENLSKQYMLTAITKRRDELMQDSGDKITRFLGLLEAEATDQDNSDSARVRSLELLLKAAGAFVDRQETVVYEGTFLADIDLSEDPEELDPGTKSNEVKNLH